MFPSWIEIPSLQQSFDRFLGTLLDVIAGETGGYADQCPCTREVLVRHIQERVDASRVGHTVRYPRRARRGARPPHPNAHVATRRACTVQHRSEVRARLRADTPRRNPAIAR